MAKRPDQPPDSEERTDTVLYNNDGEEILRFGFVKWDSQEGDTEVTQTEAEYVEFGDGTYGSPNMMMQPGRDRLVLQTCDICLEEMRRTLSRKSVFVSPASRIRRCWSCHRNLCTRHQFLSSTDLHIRCSRCDRRHFWGQAFLAILHVLLFERERR